MMSFKQYIMMLKSYYPNLNYETISYTQLPLFKVKLKITTRCNFKCSKCRYWRTQSNGDLPFDVICGLIDKLAQLGVINVKLSGGEPTLRKDLPDIISYIKNNKMYAGMTTNAYLINKEFAKRILSAGIDEITISIDSPDPREHDKSVGVKGAWEAALRAVKLLNMYRKQKGEKVNLIIQSVVTNINYRKMPYLIILAHKVGADMVSILPLNDFLNENAKQLKLSPIQFKYFIRNIPMIENIAKRLLVKLRIWHPSEEEVYFLRQYKYTLIPCIIASTHLHINADGNVGICCITEKMGLHFGNIKKDNLVKIMESQSMLWFRRNCKPPVKVECSKYCLAEYQMNKYFYSCLYKRDSAIR